MATSTTRAANTKFTPGAVWLDTSGNPIKAHGGGILYHDNVYYWYGEHQDPNVLGVGCYSSTDLYNWKNEGIAIYVANISQVANVPCAASYIIERPKVLYNEASETFVMWMHLDNDQYTLAHTAVAISKTPAGPFKYVSNFAPNNLESRDMTVFQDSNGKAYLIRSSGHTNLGIGVSELTSNYQNVTNMASYIGQSREGPAILHRGGTYYLVLSHCMDSIIPIRAVDTGWQSYQQP
eukprot:TRINITY_DN3617_c0_g1_i3.p1 TRINITY_DN3617_c0_g1~~TRINITY_DN3617_c0_g1_i3.p1  ORF type:complete len:259 (-),score=46.84 TRINITY_DN3617_c0_g1_i3:317-1024(-)